jgi:hypothetical protein
MDVSDHDIKYLKSLANRLRENPRFMAHTLSQYQKLKSLDDNALAAELGAIPEMIVRLALCQKPEQSNINYEEQISELSDFTLIDEANLEQVIVAVDRAVEDEKAPVPQPVRGWKSVVGSVCRLFNFRQHPRLILAGSLCFVVVLAITLYQLKPFSQAAIPPENSVEGQLPMLVPDKTPDKDITGKSRADSPVADARPVSPVLPRRTPRFNIKIDLEEYGVLRGFSADENAGLSQEKVIRLPHLVNRVQFTLPEGGLAGSYRVMIKDGSDKTVSSTNATSRTGKILDVKLNLQNLKKKKYHLCISREVEAPYCYAIVIID